MRQLLESRVTVNPVVAQGLTIYRVRLPRLSASKVALCPPATLGSCLMSMLGFGINPGFLMSWIAQINAIQQAHSVQRVFIKADLTCWQT